MCIWSTLEGTGVILHTVYMTPRLDGTLGEGPYLEYGGGGNINGSGYEEGLRGGRRVTYVGMARLLTCVAGPL